MGRQPGLQREWTDLPQEPGAAALQTESTVARRDCPNSGRTTSLYWHVPGSSRAADGRARLDVADPVHQEGSRSGRREGGPEEKRSAG